MKNPVKNRITVESVTKKPDTSFKPTAKIIDTRGRNASYKRKTEEVYKKSGFTATKLRLGKNVMDKLGEIYEDLLGEEIDLEHKDLEALSRVVSYCISKCYKEMYIKKGKGDLPDITPAKTSKAQQLYDLYQAVSFQEATGHSLDEISREMTSWKREQFSPRVTRSGQGKIGNEFEWSRQKIEPLLDIHSVNDLIEKFNKRKVKKITNILSAEKP